MNTDFIFALLGGIIIGVSVTLMLYFNGRVTGISGIVSGLLSFDTSDKGWRASFIFGLLFGGVILFIFDPIVFLNTTNRDTGWIIMAGFLVGFGTIMGSGCTSGHGVCGISRFSVRSIVATISFIISGVITTIILSKIGV